MGGMAARFVIVCVACGAALLPVLYLLLGSNSTITCNKFPLERNLNMKLQELDITKLPLWSMTSITPEVGKLILECFGGCTNIYECCSENDMIERFLERVQLKQQVTRQQWVLYRVCDFIVDEINAQGVHNEHSIDAACHREEASEYHEGLHAKVIGECKDMIAGIVERCKDCRILPPSFTLESDDGCDTPVGE